MPTKLGGLGIPIFKLISDREYYIVHTNNRALTESTKAVIKQQQQETDVTVNIRRVKNVIRYEGKKTLLADIRKDLTETKLTSNWLITPPITYEVYVLSINNRFGMHLRIIGIICGY